MWVITGASSGIGRRTATDVAATGARVCVAARREDLLERLVEEMGGDGLGHSWLRTDVTRRADVQRLARHVERTYGRCDVLVNNAGVSIERPYAGPDAIDDVSKVVATNFLGMVYAALELVPLLERSAPSHVVNVSSIAGRIALGSNAAYTASKFAAVGWSEALHFELAPKGIWVSTVEPGPVPTEGFPQDHVARVPLARAALADTRDVSRAIRDAVDGHKLQRVVPRAFYLLQVPRVATPPLFRLAQRLVYGYRNRRIPGAGQ